MDVKVETTYPHSGGQYFQVVYYSKEILNKEIAKIHKERVIDFLKKENKRIKSEEKKFKETLRKSK